MPAAKSRKRLPSMSSTVRPSPRTGTIGYARGRLGDVQVSSNSTWARALGPGSSVTMCGTGRSPAMRDAPDDKVHLSFECITSMQCGYLGAEYSRADAGRRTPADAVPRRAPPDGAGEGGVRAP